ncbi:MAG: hypothetical protein AAB875_01995, partial [Patescibacteria group bacterium]
EVAGKLIFYFLILFGLFLIAKRKLVKREEKDAFLLISVWIFFALVGFGLYKQEIYDHYYGFFFAAPFLLFGGVVEGTFRIDRKEFFQAPIFFGIFMLIFANIAESPLKYPPNNQMARSKLVAERIAEEGEGKKFNLAVIAERNYEDGYQYFLEKMEAPVIDIDAQRPETITETLFVGCEQERDKCDPTHNPKAEVANFGWSRIENEWEVGGVTLFKLIHAR